MRYTPSINDRCELRSRVFELLEQEKQRQELIGGMLFSNPAWIIVLDLFASYIENRPVTVGDAVLVGGIPRSTGSRLIRALEAQDIIYIKCDQSDRRRSIIQLTPTAIEKVQQLIAG